MKQTLLLTAAALLAATSSAYAVETLDGRFRTVHRAELTRFNVDSSVSAGRIQSGSVEVDTWTKEATLTLYRNFFCPPGQLCIQVMPAPIEVTLPIVETRKDDCGTRTMIARTDERAQGGRFEEIEIRDNSKNKCPHFAPLADTEVTYVIETVNPQAKSRSTFSGGRFMRQTETPLDTMSSF